MNAERGSPGSAREHAAHGAHQLVHLGVRVGWAGALAGEAVARVAVEQAQGDAVQRGPRGVDLSEDVDAVAVLLDHPPDAAHLALDAREALEELVLVGGVSGELGVGHTLGGYGSSGS